MTNIRLCNVTKKFGGTLAADSLDLDVMDKEYLCILGPTGAGKTTTLRMICGLTAPTSGKVYFDDQDVTGMEVERREAVMLSQVYSLFPHMNVQENVLFGPAIKEWSEKDCQRLARNMLEMVHLSNRADAYPHELSGGMQQRTALARALASGSKVLLLDEPLRALDARLRIELRKELRSLAKSLGLTCVHVTHDQDEALVMADRIAVLRQGKVVQVGTPKELFENPNSPFVANFLGQSNFFTGRVVEKGEWTVVEDERGIKVPARPCDLPLGTEVVVAVKVGNTRIKAGEGLMKGKVERMLYEGSNVHVDLLLCEKLRFSVKMPNRKIGDFDVGCEAHVDWNPQEALVFPLPPQGLEEELRVD
ncbi:MAG: ABC transporter ATP-binding protein [Candidatus Methanomethylophilaceae archaeon]